MINKETAIAMAESGWWHGLPAREVVEVQLCVKLLCMDFSAFHAALEEALDRPVYTHELADWSAIVAEFYGDQPAPTEAEIVEKLRPDLIIVAPCS